MFSAGDIDARDESLAIARAIVLAPIGGVGLVEQAVRRLGEAIGLGLVRVGERLPHEAELAEQLGIAPMTLRQALAILREAGYLETRRGRGGGTVVVRAMPLSEAEDAEARLGQLTVEALRDLVAFRRLVAGESAALASERAVPAQLGELATLVEQMAALPPFPEYRTLDCRFHLLLATAARSARLLAAEAQLQTEFGELLALVPHPRVAMRHSNEQHRAILAAVADGDADGARRCMQEHVDGTGDFLVGLRLGRVGR